MSKPIEISNAVQEAASKCHFYARRLTPERARIYRALARRLDDIVSEIDSEIAGNHVPFATA